MPQPIQELEAKCRDKLKSEWRRVTVNPNLILQLIEERRLLARLAMGLREMQTDAEWQLACELRDRVLQEIDQCKS